ncbi:uncharacterized protein FOMMEDRAFT_115176 [Fomitiporia mediterranea MF3/22]|uniref:Uncharacterized protein n=1 Tax=Fomitiporia mediterranea (strain MF3/22) TaxID=694068 RepID=R7SJ44_FOMME|nr:uncharacterized protein FOMMEDRAFT_115176 [Fomitiporia mediterranea MF3/22]EJC97639.1 hypothetical protein FOMMEDRAFT_115176 [Fomitiporia mediterranea MF3/22]
MATLTRTRELSAPAQTNAHSLLDSHIPSPFPSQVLEREREEQGILDELANEDLDMDPFADQMADDQELPRIDTIECSSLQSQTGSQEQEAESTAETELLPTLAHVQQSCLMTLNNLLSGVLNSAPNWQPILPPRRHSMPSRPENTSADEPSSALQTLLANLRNSDYSQMSEASSSSADDSVLISELQRRVETLSHELAPSDAQLSRALISLLAHVNRLASIDPKLFGARAPSTSLDVLTVRPQFDIYDQLSRQVLDLQIQRLDTNIDGLVRDVTPQRKVEIALLWTKIDQELETVSNLCRQRNESLAPVPYSPGGLPPEYDYDHEDDESLLPPEYDHAYSAHSATEKEKNPIHSHQHVQGSDVANEKIRMDFDAVTMAIDRLYLVAPQLHNQRVELRKSKVDELERARLAGPSLLRNAERLAKGKEKEKDVRELEKIFDMVGKASSRRMDDQSVDLDPDMKTRIERSIQRDKAKRDAFVEHLLSHSNSRRIDSQDATFQSDQVKSDDALLTLPEFIREKVPEELQQELERDPEALLTLSEIVKEPPPAKAPKASPSSENLKGSKKHFKVLTTKRNRSLSAPPLSWLIPSLSRTPSSSRLSQSTNDSSSVAKRLTVRYVAEHHENLNHVLVFIGVDEGMNPGVDLEADVLPSVGDPTVGDKLTLRCGPSSSAPLSLPVLVPSGKAAIQVQGGHYEIKFPLSVPSPRSSNVPTSSLMYRRDGFEVTNSDPSYPSQLLDAAQVAEMDPTSFICASCSSALVQAQAPPSQGGKLSYLDLPSEHWAELLEAWMCHPDQKLVDSIARHGRGFWPKPGQAFVGGSYFLFDESAVSRLNLRVLDPIKGDEWKRVQCICGAVIGRCQSHPVEGDESQQSMVYRIPKYALRPVSLTSEPVRVPLSAFILEDMLELVRAHATYRFVILDEEEERPRLLIWLFKPHMHLSYATTAQYALPRTGSVHASKVLFKILQVGSPRSQPFNLESILQKYPGFPQAERLLYPLDVCQRLMALLKESNTAYPFGVRVMTGLLAGWLQRV